MTHFCGLWIAPRGTTLAATIFMNDQRIKTIGRRPHNAPPVRETGPRINDRITSKEIRLIGAEGENVGVVSPARAMDMADEAGLDLVEISPNANPPVCKIMDYGKFKYETQKKEAEARKKQKIIEIKEVKFRTWASVARTCRGRYQGNRTRRELPQNGRPADGHADRAAAEIGA